MTIPTCPLEERRTFWNGYLTSYNIRVQMQHPCMQKTYHNDAKVQDGPELGEILEETIGHPLH